MIPMQYKNKLPPPPKKKIKKNNYMLLKSDCPWKKNPIISNHIQSWRELYLSILVDSISIQSQR